MAPLFSRTFHVGWADMDFNAHMRNTAYLDMSADVRMMYFAEHGFSMREFERRRIGPVVMRDELEYFRELRLLEPVTVTLALAALSQDAASFSRMTTDVLRR
jgi:acyl-CoA thioester hydrolase